MCLLNLDVLSDHQVENSQQPVRQGLPGVDEVTWPPPPCSVQPRGNHGLLRASPLRRSPRRRSVHSPSTAVGGQPATTGGHPTAAAAGSSHPSDHALPPPAAAATTASGDIMAYHTLDTAEMTSQKILIHNFGATYIQLHTNDAVFVKLLPTWCIIIIKWMIKRI